MVGFLTKIALGIYLFDTTYLEEHRKYCGFSFPSIHILSKLIGRTDNHVATHFSPCTLFKMIVSLPNNFPFWADGTLIWIDGGVVLGV